MLVEEDVETVPDELEARVKPALDELKEINLGSADDLRPTYVSARLGEDEVVSYVEMLKEFRDIFAWSYKEMLGLDPKVAVHHFAVKKGVHPVK